MNIKLSEFPDIKLSYENITHKKVYKSDMVMAIPEGPKCFAWFTHYQDAPVCLIIDDKKQNIKQVLCCFKTDLAYGTIVSGTMIAKNQFFAIQDIFHYKGADVSRKNWADKMGLFHKLMTIDMQQIAYNRNFVVFGMPPFANTYEEVIVQVKAIRGYRFHPYPPLGKVEPNVTLEKVSAKQEPNAKRQEVKRQEAKQVEGTSWQGPNPLFRKVEQNAYSKGSSNPKQFETNASGRKPNNFACGSVNTFVKGPLAPPFLKVDKVDRMPRVKESVFVVKPDIQNDIYHLYEGDKYHSVALIPDYKTSVMMNKLFRNIKENTNLDTLEESDDEDEFENDRDDRFVFLDKSYKMVCAYNHKFKKWAPVRLVSHSV
jgi:hypothetical protein